jgi:hypothetical protein
VYGDQQTRTIETTPVVKSQSACAAPRISTAPRSVVQVPMADGEPTGLGEVSVSVSMLPTTQTVSDEEEENDEDEQAGQSDDEEEVDDVNHASLPKEAVRANSPTQRPQTVDIWKHVRRITKQDVTDRGMKSECTHVCVYRLDDGEDGEKCYCNSPLKLFRASKAKEAVWSTSAELGHFKKKHDCSSSVRKQKVGLVKRQTHLLYLLERTEMFSPFTRF